VSIPELRCVHWYGTDVRSGPQQGQPSFLPPPMPQSAPPPPPPAAADISALVAQKRAEVQAKLAAMRSKMAGAPPANAPPPPPPSSSRSTLPPVPGLPKPNLDPDLARKVADAKRLVESFALKGRSFAAPVNPYMVSPRFSFALVSLLTRRRTDVRLQHQLRRTTPSSTLPSLGEEDWA
jgi:hypothetical protein